MDKIRNENQFGIYKNTMTTVVIIYIITYPIKRIGLNNKNLKTRFNENLSNVKIDC